MPATRFYKIMIILLVLINLSTLGFLWWNRPPGPPPHPGERPELSSELGLTGADKKAVDRLEKEHHAKKHQLIAKDRALHTAYFKLVGTSGNSDSVLTLVQANKLEIERMTFAFFNEVASHCSTAQQELLHQFIQQRLVEMGGPPPPPRH